MNYLAHLFLAERVEPSAAFIAGSLLPDFVRGRLHGLTPSIARGVALHRWVDRVTDSDAVAARTRERFRPVHGRFAGVIADVLYDHCLAREFARWSNASLAEAIERYHGVILRALPELPSAAQPGLRRLVDAGWMTHYASGDGIRYVLGLMEARLSVRFDRSIQLSHAVDTYAGISSEVDSDFESFFGSMLARLARGDHLHGGERPNEEEAA